MSAKTKLALTAALGLALSACGGPAEHFSAPVGETMFATEPDAQWRLPRGLEEVSGLALMPDGALISHDDERGELHLIDVEAGRRIARIGVGEPPLTGDFEGVAIVGEETVYLITSSGVLVRAHLSGTAPVRAVTTYDTGLSERCEIEGLAYDQARNSLIIACKTVFDDSLEDLAVFFAWSLEDEALIDADMVTVSLSEIAEPLGLVSFSPSGVEIDPVSGRLLVVAARENAFAELSREGEVISLRRLSRLHVQAEGVSATAEGDLAIVDEAGGRGDARLTIYRRRDVQH